MDDSIIRVTKTLLKSRQIFALLIIFTLLCGYSITAYPLYDAAQMPSQNVANKLFPRPKAIEKDVQFWTKVYTEVSTSEGYIHDNADLSIIYEKISVRKNIGYKARSRYTKKYKKKYKKILDKLIHALRNKQGSQLKVSQLSKEQQRVLALWPENVTYQELSKAKKRLRFQLGQSNKFKAGLIRSGQWQPYIINILKKMDLPLELAALPHVESSFNHKAYSKVGAAGMWQFTRSTGRRYMRVDQVLDERLDPFIASLSAARLLKNNYAVTGTWPLALTAYNHGASGMRRAAKKLGTKNIATILRKYKSRRFGFASRNFYPSFLAALEISSQPEKYFANIKLAPAANYEFIALNDFFSMDTIINELNIERDDLMATNLALRPAVWNGNKYIPKSYKLRIDRSLAINIPELINDLHNIDSSKRFKEQKIDRFHRVKKGQTLGIIAARYGVRLRDLISSNNMRNKHIIRIGQVLIVPEKAAKNTQLVGTKKTRIKEKNPPKTESAAVSEDGIYVVKKNDSIERIARNNSISSKQLLKLNNLANKNKIYPGQRLVLIAPQEIAQQKMLQSDRIDSQLFKTAEILSESLLPGEIQPVSMADKQSNSIIVKISSDAESDHIPLIINADKDTEKLNGDAGTEPELGALLADPSDYSVNDKHSIEIQAAETLGHYAQWLQIRARDLRRLNKMKYGKPVLVGNHLKLNFSKVTPQDFEAQRILYHKSLQEEFFERNQIIGADKYQLNQGDSLWSLTRNTYKIPFWLLRQYNPDLDMRRISANRIITFPKVQQRNI